MTISPSGSDLSSSVTQTNNPLVARYTVNHPDGAEALIEFGPTTEYGLCTWQQSFGTNSEISILVAGMQAGSEYHMRARVELRDGSVVYDTDQAFETGVLPLDQMPVLTVTATGIPSPGVELVNMNPKSPVVTDLNGNVLWFYFNEEELQYEAHPMPIKNLPNGNMMVLVTNCYSKAKSSPYSVLREVDLACDTVVGPNGLREIHLGELNKKLESIETPFGRTVQVNFFSHDFCPLDNGHVVMICQEYVECEVDGQQILVKGDALVDLDETMTPAWVWSAFDVLDVNRHPFGWNPPDDDWTHCNAITITPDGNLMLSSRSQSWVMKIDYANGSGSGKILWKLGPDGDFQLESGDAADWFYNQHYPHILTATDTAITSITVFDNGNSRPSSGAVAPYSRGLIVNINEADLTAKIAWQYPTAPDFFSYWGGDVMQLPAGTMEICASHPTPTHSFAVEVTPKTLEVVWQMNVSPAFAYRSYRIPSLYPGVIWGNANGILLRYPEK